VTVAAGGRRGERGPAHFPDAGLQNRAGSR
jgi:hypothetical protein